MRGCLARWLAWVVWLYGCLAGWLAVWLPVSRWLLVIWLCDHEVDQLGVSHVTGLAAGDVAG